MADKIRDNQLGQQAILAFMADDSRMPSLGLPADGNNHATENDTIDGEDDSPSQAAGGLEGKLSVHESVFKF